MLLAGRESNGPTILSSMKLLSSLLFLALACIAPAQDAAPKVSPWEKEIVAYEKSDKETSAPSEAVVFNGSSSIRLWKLQDSFPGWKVVNHGIGGSIIPENTDVLDRLVFPLKPKAIVFYAGDNDIAKKRAPKQVAEDWAAYVAAVRAKLPETKIVYISIKPSIQRWKLWGEVQEANKLIKEVCEKSKDVKFIDVSTVMLDEKGEPVKALFREDGLHMLPAGYERWTKLVAPEIEALAK